MDALSSDLLESELIQNPANTAQELYEQCHNTLSVLLDNHAPVKSKIIKVNTQPWLTSTIVYNKQRKRQMERLWRKEKSSLRRSNLRKQVNFHNRLVANAKRKFYSEQIEKNKNDPKKTLARTQ